MMSKNKKIVIAVLAAGVCVLIFAIVLVVVKNINVDCETIDDAKGYASCIARKNDVNEQKVLILNKISKAIENELDVDIIETTFQEYYDVVDASMISDLKLASVDAIFKVDSEKQCYERIKRILFEVEEESPSVDSAIFIINNARYYGDEEMASKYEEILKTRRGTDVIESGGQG